MARLKETTRQKLINMMYLVLTAMLALNVSNEVLDAFVVVDDGLAETTQRAEQKNGAVYEDFERQAALNPDKAGAWKDKADMVHASSDSLVAYVQRLKQQIVRLAEGRRTQAIRADGTIDGRQINAKENMDYASQMMIQERKGEELREKLDAYRELLLSLVADGDTVLQTSLNGSLNTQRVTTRDGMHTSWESYYFENMPLMAALANLSKIQGDVRNAESDVLQHLMTQIDIGAYKFNKLDALVLSSSDYVLSGETYEAQVIMAAYDSTTSPAVYIGDWRSRKLPDGTTDYEMISTRDSIRVLNGKGLYRRIAGAPGIYSWKGLVQIRNNDGTYTRRPFEASYQVGTPNAVISATKMNVLYVGVDNPVTATVSGVPNESVSVRIDNGTITKDGAGGYIVRPGTAGENATITVSAMVNGVQKTMGTMLFRVKEVPDPVAKIGDKKGGTIDKATLAAQIALQAELEYFDFDMKFTIVEFKVSGLVDGFLQEKASSSARLTDEQKALINRLSKNSKVYFEDIKAQAPDGTIRELAPMQFRIN